MIRRRARVHQQRDFTLLLTCHAKRGNSGTRRSPEEIWGYFLTHYAVTALICTAATNAGIDPDRVKFKRAIRIIRRADDPAFSP